MPLEDCDLREIISRASSFAERLENRKLSPDEKEEDESKEIDELLAHWEFLVAPGDHDAFMRRLAWDGLDIQSVRRGLRNPVVDVANPFPEWCAILRDAVTVYEALPYDADYLDRSCNLADPIPFEEIVLPFVWLARFRLLGDDGQASGITSSALGSLERSLLLQLTEQFQLPLFHVFTSEQAKSDVIQSINVESGKYRAFASKMRSTEIVIFFIDFPVLARLAAETVQRWITTCSELLERLNKDLEAIGNKFCGGDSPGQLVALGTDLSDAHDGGRSVAALRFESGLRLIYKPRDLRIEIAYFSLLEWLNENGAPLVFRALNIIERDNYGWVEFVENSECADESEAERYFERAGMLLCLVYALGGTDLHCENVVAAGEQPVLVDLETILHAQLHPLEEIATRDGALFLAEIRVLEGVLGTGLLPWWVVGEDHATVDISGLGGVAEQRGIDRVPRWTNPKTDRMDLTFDFGTIPVSGNVVRVRGRPASPTEYMDSIVDGFRAMHALLQRESQRFLATGGPLDAFAELDFRFLFRDTRVYSKLLMSTLNCETLQDGARRSIELDVLSKPLLQFPALRRFWPLRKAEQAALEQFDIPYFSTRSQDNVLLLDGGGELEDCLAQAPLHRAHTRVQALVHDDVDALSRLIRASLYTRTAINGVDEAAPEDEPDAGAPTDADEFFAYAKRIADSLRDEAIRSTDGSVSWIGLGFLPVAERFQLQAVGSDLYSGYLGIAMYLAAFSKVMANDEFRQLALGALQVLRQQMADDRNVAEFLASEGIGGASGAGSVVYALVRTGEFIGDASLIDDAARLAARMPEEFEVGDAPFLDVISGLAGAILGLLALHDATRDQWILDRAVTYGKHLLRNRVRLPSGHHSWLMRGVAKPLSGFSHGAAGIAFALLRLSERAQNADFVAAAVNGMEYERTLFNKSVGNWRDLRDLNGSPVGEDAYGGGWCHGAPGIALARMGALSAIDTPEIRSEIEIGLETTKHFGIGGLDHLCCGGMGRVDILIEGARRLSRPELFQTARHLAGATVNRAKRDGGFRTQSGIGMVDPGFFSGLSGIG